MDNIANIYEIAFAGHQIQEPMPAKVAKALREYIAKNGNPPHIEVVIEGDEVRVKEFEMKEQE